MAAGNRQQARLVLLCGLPASGKTTLARRLAASYGAVRLNPDEWDWHIDCRPGAGEPEIAAAFAAAIQLGMEIYEEEECEPDVLDDGTTRYWMSPKEPVPA